MKWIYLLLATVLVFGTIGPVTLLAQSDRSVPATPPGTDREVPVSSPGTDREVPAADGSRALTNPLSEIDSLEDLLVALLRVVVVLATPIVVLFIILAGFKYVTARGDVAKTKEATVALTYAIIGGVLIIGAVAIAEIIGNLVEAFSSGT